MLKKYMIMMCLALPLMASAQALRSDNPVVDLGQVVYFQPSTAVFSLKNASSKAVKIKDVDTGCGCTSATYPKESIPAGGEVKMRIVFDGKQLGHFQRSILVTDDMSDTPYELTLKGNVVMKVENFSGEYPLTVGSLLADMNAVEFDDVHKGDRLMREIHIMNPSGQYVEPVVMHLPSYLRAEVIPSRLAPKKGGVIRFTLDSRQLHSYGLNQTGVFLAANKGEKVSDEKEITVSTILLPEAVAGDAKERINGPHMQMSTTTVDMTDFAGKAKKKSEIVIQNTGKSNLEIQSMEMFTQGLQVTLPKRTLKPGESTKMKITGIAEQLKKVRTRPRILMITNDADMQKVIIEVKLKN